MNTTPIKDIALGLLVVLLPVTAALLTVCFLNFVGESIIALLGSPNTIFPAPLVAIGVIVGPPAALLWLYLIGNKVRRTWF
jgi:hypothetical protein